MTNSINPKLEATATADKVGPLRRPLTRNPSAPPVFELEISPNGSRNYIKAAQDANSFLNNMLA